MAYDETIEKRKIFGGVAFLASGNMYRGVIGKDLMVRVGPDARGEALERPHNREMAFTGRSMKGIVYVSPRGTRADEDLRSWVERGLAFARSLPKKEGSK